MKKLLYSTNIWGFEMEELMYFKSIGTEESGFLSSMESRHIDFHVKNIFTIHDVPKDKIRGRHAHKKLKEIMWCPFGIIEATVNDGFESRAYLLDSPEKVLFLPNGLWITIKWKRESSVLCVAASDYYDEDDYIRNYSDYINYIKEGYWNDEC